jgi:hypothetical protein
MKTETTTSKMTLLADNDQDRGVFSVKRLGGVGFRFREECDQYFVAVLTAEQAENFVAELAAFAAPHACRAMRHHDALVEVLDAVVMSLTTQGKVDFKTVRKLRATLTEVRSA